MLLSIRILAAIAILHQNLAQAHGNHDHRHDDQEHHRPSLRSLNIFSPPPGQCKDGESNYTIGGVTYQCESEFQAMGGNCRTQERTPQEHAIEKQKFKWWKEQKEKQKENNGGGKGNPSSNNANSNNASGNNANGKPKDNGNNVKNKANNRRLEGCANNASCVSWEEQIITVPTYIHIIHDGDKGRKYTCEHSIGTGFIEPYTNDGSDNSNCSFIKDQMKVLNDGFRARESLFDENGAGRSYDRYSQTESDTHIQFCLMGSTVTDNKDWYEDKKEMDMKIALGKGGMETLNIYANTAGGYLGYAYKPDDNYFDEDGVVILNDSMPGGDSGKYGEGDTLTHEVGHWLNLEHTHTDSCGGPGDYMDEYDNNVDPSREDEATFDCPVGEDNCNQDGGPNPIHNFMAYTQDNCMDEFTPGQKLWMQSAWETYRHKENSSETWGLADDDITCCTLGDTSCASIFSGPPPTPPPEGENVATYDSTRGAPQCSTNGVLCDSSNLLKGRGKDLGPGTESNAPNTIDGCVDGESGTYQDDESVEAIKVTAIGGSQLQVGGTAEIEATVWAYGDGGSDTADFYYASDATNPEWIHISSVVPDGGGEKKVTIQYTLPEGNLQAVRVNFRYEGSESPCSGDKYDDADDLVFAVADTGSLPPTRSPTDLPTKEPSASPTNNPTSSPTKAPSMPPTSSPTTKEPSTSPTNNPTSSPTKAPSMPPTSSPNKAPTKSPSDTAHPTISPTGIPTQSPSGKPTKNPTTSPTTSPTPAPTKQAKESKRRDRLLQKSVMVRVRKP